MFGSLARSLWTMLAACRRRSRRAAALKNAGSRGFASCMGRPSIKLLTSESEAAETISGTPSSGARQARTRASRRSKRRASQPSQGRALLASRMIRPPFAAYWYRTSPKRSFFKIFSSAILDTLYKRSCQRRAGRPVSGAGYSTADRWGPVFARMPRIHQSLPGRRRRIST